KRRQALVKLRSENDGSNSEVSLTGSSSPLNMNSNDIYPNMSKIKLYNWLPRNLEIEAMKQVQKSVLKNRSRRSTKDAKMSSNKNTTVLADPNLANQGNIPINAMTCALYLRLPVALPLKCIFSMLSKPFTKYHILRNDLNRKATTNISDRPLKIMHHDCMLPKSAEMDSDFIDRSAINPVGSPINPAESNWDILTNYVTKRIVTL
ncbi:Uncharacterized protein FWK35_00034386, partial [Aphis craccivora]